MFRALLTSEHKKYSLFFSFNCSVCFVFLCTKRSIDLSLPVVAISSLVAVAIAMAVTIAMAVNILAVAVASGTASR